MFSLSRRIAPLAVLASGLGATAVALAPAALAYTQSVPFTYTGSEQTFTVPDGVHSLHVVLVGGRGGSADGPAGTDVGGFGALLGATLAVSPHDTLYVEVGGNGEAGGVDQGGQGSFNGGGEGGRAFGAAGGGASDVRTLSMEENFQSSLASRLLVAGGGGGAAYGSTGADSGNAGLAAQPDSACDAAASGAPGGTAGPAGAGGGGADAEGNGIGGGSPGSVAGGGGGGTGSDEGETFGGGGGGGGSLGGGGGGAGYDCGGGGGAGSSGAGAGSAASITSSGTDTSGTPRVTISYVVPEAPQATTTAATDVGQTSATLNGVVDPGGSPTSYRFEYGTTTAYGSSTAEQDAGSGTEQEAVAAALSALSPDTTYHFRLVANGFGTGTGHDQTVTTGSAGQAPAAPQATTEPASAIGQTTATLNGVVDPEGAPTTYRFDYGTSMAYGTATATQDAGSGTSQRAVSATLTGLSPGTTYHFRVVASGNGTASGDDLTFTTTAAQAAPAPTAFTKAASDVARFKAQLNGSVNPRASATTYWFEYGTTTGYGSSTAHRSVGSGTTSRNVSAALSGLRRHTLYHFRIVAVNANGTTNGVDRTFRTG
jgi:hypothetical protein